MGRIRILFFVSRGMNPNMIVSLEGRKRIGFFSVPDPVNL